ncbi:uncharacterized protein LOC127011532 [Drosophila biarmipes]|uniref:uncharacterized protein LOC127011532 n=1 Tax=Drosophila biarmipes TaxID=125945 RepID=UPI0021CC6D00|nr:uncharacterized protein LOC127011532 [Drosophila biarmipes]
MAHWTIFGFLVILVLCGMSQAMSSCNSDGHAHCVEIKNCKERYTHSDLDCPTDEVCCKLKDIDMSCGSETEKKVCLIPELCKQNFIFHSAFSLASSLCPPGLVCCNVQPIVPTDIEDDLI